MASNPYVSVILSIYNGELYLREAMESILNQTISDFEFIIILDPSTDKSRNIIESYKDTRIILLNNDHNLGLAQSLNRGLETARGKYLVRMDADDISLPERLERQVAFMESHKEVGVCGSWLKIIGPGGGWIRELPVDHETIKCHLLFGPLIAHPTVIMRRDLLIEHNLFYNPAFSYAEDYELWSRCARHFRLANQSEVLYLYRHHAEQASRAFKDQEQFGILVILEELKTNLGINTSAEELKLHLDIGIHRIPASSSFAERAFRWFEKLREANRQYNYYPEPEFTIMLDKRWVEITNRCTVKK